MVRRPDVPAAPAPLAKIRERVAATGSAQGGERAQAVASQIAAKVARGVPLAKAVAEAGVPLPPVEPVAARRIQLAQANARSVAPLKMLFSLTQGKSRMVADPRDRGFFIVKTDKINRAIRCCSPA